MDNIKEIHVIKINNESREDISDTIIVEKPIKIFVNFELYTIMMCSPNEVKELAVGFLFSEGLITSMNCIKSIEEKFNDRVCVVLNEDIKIDYNAIQAETSGCGKGSIQLKYVEDGEFDAMENTHRISYKSILQFMKEFNTKSELFKQTGGVHSCALCDTNGILLFSEDIGRHNALDKVIGKALMSNISVEDKLVMTTGRISSDIIVKTAKASIPIIVSHSAPTHLALDIAKSANLTVIGFVRGSRMNIYCGEVRVVC